MKVFDKASEPMNPQVEIARFNYKCAFWGFASAVTIFCSAIWGCVIDSRNRVDREKEIELEAIKAGLVQRYVDHGRYGYQGPVWVKPDDK